MTRGRLAVAVAAVAAMIAGVVPALAADNEDSVGVADQTTGIWYLRSADGSTTSFYFGNPGDYPIMGDWNCDGIDTPGLYRQSDGYVYLRNSNTQGPADVKFFFGNPGDIPLAGDFNANGCDTVSIYRPAEARIFIINELGSNDGGLGAADFDYYFGNVGDKPFTADFNDTGQDTVGLHRESTGFVYYRNTLTTGIADNQFFFGDPGDQIVTGRWVQNPNPGSDTVGIFRPSDGRFYLRFSNTQGNADTQFGYGDADMAAVAGRFGSLPGNSAPPPGGPTTTTTTTLPTASNTSWNCDFYGSDQYWCSGNTDPVSNYTETWLCQEGFTWACAGEIDEVDSRVDSWACSQTSASTYDCLGDIDNRTADYESWSCLVSTDYTGDFWACSGNIDTSDPAPESWRCEFGVSPDWLCTGDVDKGYAGYEAFACTIGGPIGRAWECYGTQSWLAPVVSTPDPLISLGVVPGSSSLSQLLDTYRALNTLGLE